LINNLSVNSLLDKYFWLNLNNGKFVEIIEYQFHSKQNPSTYSQKETNSDLNATSKTIQEILFPSLNYNIMNFEMDDK